MNGVEHDAHQRVEKQGMWAPRGFNYRESDWLAEDCGFDSLRDDDSSQNHKRHYLLQDFPAGNVNIFIHLHKISEDIRCVCVLCGVILRWGKT
jgi:hypothetical protein